MRSSEQIKKAIIDFAEVDKRIRAVLLNGSRANPNIKPDKYQDYDITFLVSGIKNFISDLSWTNVFGKKVLEQLPDQMVIGDEKQKQKGMFHCLMLFEDGNRIDLTLYPANRFKSRFHIDSLTVVWLDKDQRFLDVQAPSEMDYFIREPTKKEFFDHCNEFWWVSTNVAKGLARNEIIYAKEMLEIRLRPVFMKMIDWNIGSKNSFSVSTGKGGKLLGKFLPGRTFEKVHSTYTGIDVADNWRSLFTMTKLFSKFASETAAKFDFKYNIGEEKASMNYLQKIYGINK